MPQMMPPTGSQMLPSGGGLGGTPLLYERQTTIGSVGSMNIATAAATETGSGGTAGPSSLQQPTAQQQRAIVPSQQVIIYFHDELKSNRNFR